MSNTEVEHRPSILFTNLTLAARSGSELHIFELAKAFIDRGWDVTCYTLVHAYPMQEHFAQLDIQVVIFGEEEKLASHYSVLYAQHHIVSDYIWDCTSISFDAIVVSSLGPFSEHEKLPSFSQRAGLQVFVSGETKQKNLLSDSAAPSFVFPNSVDFSQINAQQHRVLPKSPKRIAIISNHVAPELIELKNLVSPDCQIDYLGIEHQSVEISPDLLTSYDLVVSIGRTVPLCFATKTPLYCYDIHGGPGYISIDTIDADFYFNFSGRSNPNRKNASQLYSDIFEGYEKAVNDIEQLQQYAIEKLNFSNNFELLYGKIVSTASLTPAQCKRKCSDLTTINRTSQCTAFINNYSSMLGLAQLFFSHDGAIVSEDNSILLKYCYRTTIDVTNLINKSKDRGKCVRFDPDARPVFCKINGSSDVVAINSEKKGHGFDLFLTEDPIYTGLIDKLSFTCRSLSEHDYCREYHRLKANNEASMALLENELQQALERIDSLEEPLPNKLIKRLKGK
ncbi:hypothetical protein [Enorma massiliensis]|uniref:hypothetical protein n=1 Tax=Enorma massiliensis TaxID=1472761 RepID=UPI003A935AFD